MPALFKSISIFSISFFSLIDSASLSTSMFSITLYSLMIATGASFFGRSSVIFASDSFAKLMRYGRYSSSSFLFPDNANGILFAGEIFISPRRLLTLSINFLSVLTHSIEWSSIFSSLEVGNFSRVMDSKSFLINGIIICHISSVINGITGWANLKIDSNVDNNVLLVALFCDSLPC